MVVNNNKTKITIVSILLLALLALPASAGYYVSATLETVQNSGSGNAWTTPVQFNLSLTESKTLYGLTVNYADIGNSNTLAMFRITGGTATDAALAKNQVACIKGTCLATNNTPTTVGDVRLTLLDILQPQAVVVNATNTTTVLATSDNVVTVYLQCTNGEKLPLNRNGVNNYDKTTCNTKTGWSNSADKELNLFIHRNYNVPTSILVDTKGNYNEKDLVDNGNTRPYTLTSNEKYVFTVKTKRMDAWGGEVEEIGTYTLTVKDLATSGVTTGAKVRGTYKVTLPDTQSISMGEPVTFAPLTSVTITSKADNAYEFDFLAAGDYKVKYTTAGGIEDALDFSVSAPVVQAPAPTVTVPANQQQGDEGGIGNYLLGGGILLALGGLGIVMYKKSKPSTPTMHVNPLKR